MYTKTYKKNSRNIRQHTINICGVAFCYLCKYKLPHFKLNKNAPHDTSYMKTHSTERSYKCPYGQLTFKKTLRRQQKQTNWDILTQNCKICQLYFANFSQLILYMTNIHPTNAPIIPNDTPINKLIVDCEKCLNPMYENYLKKHYQLCTA